MSEEERDVVNTNYRLEVYIQISPNDACTSSANDACTIDGNSDFENNSENELAYSNED